jgi:hypothetical protein
MRTKSSIEKNTTLGIVCAAPLRLTKAQPLNNYRLKVEFTDGTKGFVKMSNLVVSDKAGIFASLKDLNVFNQAYLVYGAITWPGEIDLAPDAMYDEIKHKGEWILR